MKISEKSLELNVGAELLMLMRGLWGMPRTYLRGLTQREESQEGVDFFVQLPLGTRIFAFQFKAPKGRREGEPYRFTIQRRQHELLSQLASGSTGNVFYVLPYYVLSAKLQRYVPSLLRDTWFLPVGSMQGTDPFSTYETRTMTCAQGIASINPDYELRGVLGLEPGDGIPARRFAEWYANLHTGRDGLQITSKRRDPWLMRGLRVAIVLGAGETDR